MILLNSVSDRHRHFKMPLIYDKDEITTDVIIIALKNRIFEIKSKSKDSQNKRNLLVKGRKIGKSNYHSRGNNEFKNK